MELMRAQLETEKRKAAFYDRARLAIEDGSCFLEIRSPTQGVLTPLYTWVLFSVIPDQNTQNIVFCYLDKLYGESRAVFLRYGANLPPDPTDRNCRHLWKNSVILLPPFFEKTAAEVVIPKIQLPVEIENIVFYAICIQKLYY